VKALAVPEVGGTLHAGEKVRAAHGIASGLLRGKAGLHCGPIAILPGFEAEASGFGLVGGVHGLVLSLVVSA
jgi:hypothetical protein